MKTLIINLGPIGDVIRTTVLLSEIEGDIYWATRKKCVPALKSKKIKRVFITDEDDKSIEKERFDVVLSLNEEKEALCILNRVKFDKLIGIYLENGKIKYTPESAEWFDMSLSSVFGGKKADSLKLNNRKTYQELILKFIGAKWKGQEYDLGIKDKCVEAKVVGIIKEINGLWPNKGWEFYDELAKKLGIDGVNVRFLGIQDTFEKHIDDINNCKVIVCGDTAGMHVALALKKKVVALFNCTSPWEIYDYDRMKKIISSKLGEYFYKKTDDIEARKAISLDKVYDATMQGLCIPKKVY